MRALSRIEVLFLASYVTPRQMDRAPLLTHEQWEFCLGRTPRALHDELLARGLVQNAEPLLRGVENYPPKRLRKAVRRRGLSESGSREELLHRLISCDEPPDDLKSIPRFEIATAGADLLRVYEDDLSRGQATNEKINFLTWFGGAIGGGIIGNTADRLAQQAFARIGDISVDAEEPPLFAGSPVDGAALYRDIMATPVPPEDTETDWGTRYGAWMSMWKASNDAAIKLHGGPDLMNFVARLRFQLCQIVTSCMIWQARRDNKPWAGQAGSIVHASVEVFLSRLIPHIELRSESDDEHRVEHELTAYVDDLWRVFFAPGMRAIDTCIVDPTAETCEQPSVRRAQESTFKLSFELANRLRRVDAATAHRITRFLDAWMREVRYEQPRL